MCKDMLHVLRHGFKCYGKTFPMACFRPNSSMNPGAAENYAKNRLMVTRQVGFISAMKRPDGKNRRCVIDVTLAVNGIPVVTAARKNPLTGHLYVAINVIALAARAGTTRRLPMRSAPPPATQAPEEAPGVPGTGTGPPPWRPHPGSWRGG